ncbi:sensor histidine kinase [Eisenbergiella massiliensis]|uniref:sensor histidine kinase n=1 Tax=Eisenbergiella massiliensis TaxID=1720294 RepID=UPI0023F10247|nr:sensor histidine kinase [Eisenbergiella massiliensis]
MRKMNSIKAKPLSISLKLHVVLYYIFLIIAPFLLLVALSVNIMYKYTCRIYGKYLVTNLASTQEQLNTAYNRYRDTSMTLYLNKTVAILEKKDLSAGEWDRIRVEMSNMCASNADMASMQIDSHDTMVHAGTSNAKIVEYVNGKKEEIIAEGGRMIWLPESFYSPYPFGTYKYVIARSLNTAEKKNLGIMYMTVDKEIFDNAFATINMEGATTYIIHPSGTVLYCSDIKRLNEPFDIPDVKDKTGFFTEKVGGENCLVAYAKSYKTNWLQLAIVPVNSLFSDFKPVGLSVLFIVSVYVVLIFVMIILMNRHIVRPILSLTHAMDTFAEGNLQVSAEETCRTKEIKTLFIHFNTMTRKVHELILDNRRVEREKNNFEMQVLISQMNPHFIYNSLNTVKWLAVINKQPVIQKVTDSLIYILMQITNKGSSLHRLTDEIRLLENYTVIQKMRFMNFDIAYSISEDTQELLIRKFLLQSIVENAIIHGFSRGKLSDGRIELKSYKEEERLHVIIRDNGKGFDVQEWESREEPADKQHTNVGIKNIQQIIKLEYGTSYGLFMESEPGKGTCAHFILPVLEDGEME